MWRAGTPSHASPIPAVGNCIAQKPGQDLAGGTAAPAVTTGGRAGAGPQPARAAAMVGRALGRWGAWGRFQGVPTVRSAQGARGGCRGD